jgi:indolepyruvate ferredoxin oxidoreductase
MIERHIATLKGEQIPVLASLARLPEMIRGYGHIKEQNINKSLAEKARLEADLENNHFAVAAEWSLNECLRVGRVGQVTP